VGEVAEDPSLGPDFRLGLRLLRQADDERLWDAVVAWGALLNAVARLSDGDSRILAALRYVGNRVGGPSPERWREVLAHLPRDTQEHMMTWEQAIEARGEARGEAKGLREALRTLLGVRFGELSNEVSSRLEGADVAQLSEWMLRCARGVSSPEELFDGR